MGRAPVETLLHIGLSNTLLATGLAVLAAVIAALTRRPALAHGLWLLVLLKLLTPSFVHIPILPSTHATPPNEPAMENTIVLTFESFNGASEKGSEERFSDAPLNEPPQSELQVEPEMAEENSPGWPTVLGAVWLIGSAGWFFLAARRVWRFRRLLRHAQAVSAELQAEIERLAHQLGLRRCPEIRFIPGAVSPMLWSLGGRPLLLLPAELWQRLTEEQRQTLAAHELAHLARRDHWVRALEFLSTGLFWWNPVLWWARHGLREAEERCCDAWVVWVLPAAARAYATALVETVDFLSEARSPLPAAASGIGHVRILKRRLTMILQGKTPRALSATGFLMLAALAALLLPMLPTWAQEPTETPKKEGEKSGVENSRPAMPDIAAQGLGGILLQLQRQKAAGEGTKEIDQIIAELKKKLTELEARRAQEKAKPTGDDKKKMEEIEKARAEVKKLAETAQKKQAEAMEARAKLHAAVIRLGQMEGGQHTLMRFHFDNLEGPTFKYRVVPKGENNQAELWKLLQALPPNGEDRLRHLEKQLADLLREVKELRKEKK